MKVNINKLKELRDYLESGEWKKHGDFCMSRYWSHFINEPRSCGCVMGHWSVKSGYLKKGTLSVEFMDISEHFISTQSSHLSEFLLSSYLSEFLFSGQWYAFDNTPEGAIGRIDAVINGLRF